MRIRDLRAAPKEQKITEGYLRQVLISSVCGILLCMSCLAGTTWAWFTVSIENCDNVIQIGRPEVKLTVDGAEYPSGTVFSAGSYRVSMEHANEWDDFQKKSELYVILTLQSGGETESAYAVLREDNAYTFSLEAESNQEFALSWEVSWIEPNAVGLAGDKVSLTVEVPEAETTAPTGEDPAEPQEDGAGETDPTQVTAAPEETEASAPEA